MYIFQQKLKKVKSTLGAWAKLKYGKGELLSMSLEAKLAIAYLHSMASPGDAMLAKLEFDLQDQYRRALSIKENMRRQKLRIKWNILGDRNTNYYHDSLMIKHA